MGFNSRGFTRQNNFDSFNVDPIIFDGNLYESRYQNIRHDGVTNNQNPPQLGSYGKFADGRVARYVRYADTAATAEGTILTHALTVLSSSVALSTDGLSFIASDSTYTAALKPDFVGGVVVFKYATTGSMVVRRIVDHTQSVGAVVNTYQLDRPAVAADFIAGVAGAFTATIYRPFTVTRTGTGGADSTVGVSVGVISARDTTTTPNGDLCGWVITKGVTPVICTNSSTAQAAITATGPSPILIPGGTAGSAVLATWTGAGTITGLEVAKMVAYGFGFLITPGVASGADTKVLANVDCSRFGW